jgi:opacity protein-like surface antigen
MKLRILCMAVAAFLATSALFAQVREGTVEIEPFAGYLWGGRFAHGTTELFTSTVDVDDHATYGGRIGFNATQVFELEFQYSRTDTAFVTGNGGGVFGPGPAKLGDLKIEYFLGYATFNFGHSRVVPFFTVGAGAAHLTPTVEGANPAASTRFTASLGGGVKVFVTPHFGFRFDGRAYTTSLGTTNHSSCDRWGCTNSSWLTNGEASGGILFAF